jgi:hypothetical protein
MNPLRLNRFRGLPVALLVAVGGLTAACSPEPDSPVQPDLSVEQAVAATPESALDSLALSLAMTLGEPGGRSMLLRELRGSPFKERKVDFKRVMRSQGDLREGVASRVPDRLDIMLSALPEIEMYLPVPSHRSAWKGGSNLLVAWQLDEWTDPVGYDLAGNRVALSVEAPPDVPVLVLVPAETDFSRPPTGAAAVVSQTSFDQPAAASPAWCDDTNHTSSGDVRLICVEILDLKESWPRGDPEIELHVEGLQLPSNLSDNTARSLQCRPSSQDDHQWSGTLPAVSEQWFAGRRLSDSPSRDGVILTFWEDDSTSCVIDTSFNWWQTLVLAGTSYATYQIGLTIPAGNLRALTGLLGVYGGFSAIVSLGTVITGGGDDIIGNIHFGGGQDLPWSIRDENGNYNGQVLCDRPFWSVVSGPYPIFQAGNTTWTAQDNYAPASVSHEWHESTNDVTWTSVSSGGSYSRSVSNTESPFYLRLTSTSNGEVFAQHPRVAAA